MCGVDEAGAGPLAGPVYAAAVILPHGLELPWLNDSKQVTPKRRDTLFNLIREQAAAWSVASVSAKEIDEMDILNARMLAMQRAIDGLTPSADYALIDGNRDHGSRYTIVIAHETVVKGDSLSFSIAAASILAKVSRDQYMEAGGGISPVPLRPAQGLRHQAPLRNAGSIWPQSRPQKNLPPEVGGPAPWMSASAWETKGRRP